jgi:hypothetical protein
VQVTTVNNITFVGNSFKTCTTAMTNTSTVSNFVNNGQASTPVLDRSHTYMKNTSGSTVNAGDLVIIKSVAGGDEYTTSTTAGDNKVYGMAVATVTTGNYGYIQTLGKTTLLKVNGTADIAIGDFISHYTTAGIGQKAVAGHTAIAIALEAYITDDSSGVIDAVLIPPRLI